MKNVFLLVIALAVISACRNPKQDRQLVAETGLEDSTLLIRPQYAQGFTVKYLADNVRLVEVVDPQTQDDGERMPIGYADYWRILNSYPGDFSYDALLASEPRNALFRAFKEKHVIYCNMRQTPYYESAPVEPDQVLADLVAIFHPELLPNHVGKYYRLLKP